MHIVMNILKMITNDNNKKRKCIEKKTTNVQFAKNFIKHHILWLSPLLLPGDTGITSPKAATS